MISLGSTDITLSRMGLGTWAIGGGPAWNGDLDLQICIDTIVEAHRCGINLIDTAPLQLWQQRSDCWPCA